MKKGKGGILPVKHIFFDPNYFEDKTCLIMSPDLAITSMVSEMGLDYIQQQHGVVEDDTLLSVDFVLLTGGTDISPAIYHQSRGDHTNIPDAERDHAETTLIKKCIVLGVPVVGICRGAQLLSSVLGGRLVQHDISKDHLGTHDLWLANGFILEKCQANHHQLIVPPPSSKVIASYQGVKEIIYHPTVGISVQYHPEWHVSTDRQFKYFFRLVHDLLEDKL